MALIRNAIAIGAVVVIEGWRQSIFFISVFAGREKEKNLVQSYCRRNYVFMNDINTSIFSFDGKKTDLNSRFFFISIQLFTFPYVSQSFSVS